MLDGDKGLKNYVRERGVKVNDSGRQGVNAKQNKGLKSKDHTMSK